MSEMYCHHDDFVLSERELKLLRDYQLWVDTVRKHGRNHGADWVPGYPDLMKSRLFWWIRSGHEPLPSPPPTAWSCPWYEVVTEHEINHRCIDAVPDPDWPEGKDKAVFAQCAYDVYERKSDGAMIVGFGPYRFLAFRDPEVYARQIAEMNPHSPECYETYLKRANDNPREAWFLRRQPELEAK